MERLSEVIDQWWEERVWLFFSVRGAEFVKVKGSWRRVRFGTYAKRFWNFRKSGQGDGAAVVFLLRGGNPYDEELPDEEIEEIKKRIYLYDVFLRLVWRFFDQKSFSEEEETSLVSFFQTVFWRWPLDPLGRNNIIFFPGVLGRKRGFYAVVKNEVQAVVVELLMKLVFRWGTEARLCPRCGLAHFGKRSECGKCRVKHRLPPKVRKFRNLLYKHKHEAKAKGLEVAVRRITERAKDIKRGRPFQKLVSEHFSDCKRYGLPTEWARNYGLE
ncbi:MAG: hypothetical protein ACPLTR_05970 [Thermacetogeniaceae bacterium]